MLLCGLCVNSINILFRDLRGFLPFCLSSGDPGISLWAVGQHHFVYRKKQQAEERGPRPHPKLHFLCGETCQDGALTCIWKREQHFQPLENRRWSVKLEPWHATLTGHPPSTRPTPSPKTVTDLGPARRDLNQWSCFLDKNRRNGQSGLLLQNRVERGSGTRWLQLWQWKI